MEERYRRHAHVVLVVLFCLVAPLLSRVLGPTAGYTMFAGFTDYTLRIQACTGGVCRPILPSTLAPRAQGYLSVLLSQGDTGARVRSVDALRTRLDPIAALTCGEVHASEIDIDVEEHLDDGEVRRTHASAACPPP